jgi:hypothetical protein
VAYPALTISIALPCSARQTYPSGMSQSPDGEHEARPGEMCSRIGTWEGGDQHHELIDIKAGEMFPTCPYCGRAIGWTYLHE